MTVSATFRMADRLAGGNLRGILADLVADGKSHDGIAARLYAEYGIEVTRQTVSNWLKALDIEKPLARAINDEQAS